MSFNNTILNVTNNGMGNGPEELQLLLVGKYLQLLGQNNDLPAVICFYTNGVKLVTDGSPIIEFLADLERKGVRLIVCSTCLDFFGITDKVRIGIVGGMPDILEAQLRAEKVITL